MMGSWRLTSSYRRGGLGTTSAHPTLVSLYAERAFGPLTRYDPSVGMERRMWRREGSGSHAINSLAYLFPSLP